MRMIYLPLCAAALMLCGCDKDAQSTEAKEEKNPLVRTGHSYMEIKEWDKAAESFKQAIENSPTMARPHLDLAIIYQQHKPSYINYVKAIYHYDRYLELLPDSEKAPMINEQKIKVAEALASTAINNSPQVKQLIAERNSLRQENSKLKQQLASQKQTAPTKSTAAASTPTATKPKSVTETVPKSTASTGDAQYQIYTVKAGDTLTKIAKQFYGTSDYDPIYEANKDRMKSPSSLRPGQTLVIPKR